MAPSAKPYLLLIEGPDDCHVIIQLMKGRGIGWEKIEEKLRIDSGENGRAAGVEGLLRGIPAALKSVNRLGIVVDADKKPADRWTALRDRFDVCGVEIPPDPVSGGWLEAREPSPDVKAEGCRSFGTANDPIISARYS